MGYLETQVRDQKKIGKVSIPGVVDCLFVNPKDMLSSLPYVKTLTTISVLREAGIKVQLIDPAPEKKQVSDIFETIQAIRPSILCISAYPSTLPFAYQLCQKIRLAQIPITIVLEGYHVNADPTIIREMDIDYGLTGDTEFTMLALCQAVLKEEKPDESLQGLVLNLGNEVKINPPIPIKDINILPIPAYELMQIGKYYSASTNKRLMYVFTSRGCPYECNFCTIPTQRLYRYLDTEHTMAQLKYLVNDLRITWIEFMDLTFTVNRKRVLELCDAIQKQGLHFQWGCETRADLVDEVLLKAMKDAGCDKITFGVESGNEYIRAKTGKKISNQQFIEAFNLCKKLQIRTMANFIIGHPEETEAQMMDTLSFSKQIDAFNVFYTRMIPLPDVDIFIRGVKNGEIEPDIWIKYMKGEAQHPAYYPTTIDPKKMDRILKKALLSYYLRPSTVRKYLYLFKDIRYLFRTIGVFFEYTFGGPIFK